LAKVARSSSKAAQGTDWRAIINIGEARLAGYCSILLAASYLIFALYYQLLPSHPRSVDSILNLAGTSPGWFRFLYGTLAVGGLMGLAVVGPITRLAGDEAPAWIAWARRLAYVGFAVTIVQGVRMATLLPQLGALYHGCGKCMASLAEQQTVARTLYAAAPIDPSYWIVFGAISLWTLAVALALINSARLPAPLPYIGLALTVVYWLLIFGIAAGNIGFFTFASIVGGVILGPLWYGWLGVLLTRER
jgi:hypothetical protein